MRNDPIVQEVCRLFPAIFQCFYRRTQVQDYRPSLESLAVLQHLHAVGPMTVGEACLHFDRSQESAPQKVWSPGEFSFALVNPKKHR